MYKIETYGQSSQDLQSVIKKVAKQKDYLESQTFITAGGEEKCLLDVSYSSNHSKRYYARILNKVNTFTSISMAKGLVPVFLTITADGFFRRMINGDYREWTDDKKESYKRHIPNNSRSGFYLDYMDKKSLLTPKDVYKILSHQLHGFYKCNTLKKIKKNNQTYTSIRVTEPHKDGVPHFHILMYLPIEFVPSLYKDFRRYFPAPRNHKKLTYKNTKGKNKRNGDYITDMKIDIKGKKILTPMYETFGFQTNIISASGYILKYILKSFKNLIEDKEIDYLQSWYVHNRIPRIVTTHTLLSQDVYHKCSLYESDWHYLTDIKLHGDFEKDTLNDTFKIVDGNDRAIYYDNGFYMLTNNGKIISTYGTSKITVKKYRLRSMTFTSSKPCNHHLMHIYAIYVPPRPYSYYINTKYDDDTIFSFGSSDDFFIQAGVTHYEEPSSEVFSVKKMSNFYLYDSYNNFDFDLSSPVRYSFLHNELIDRGLLSKKYINPNDYKFDFRDENIISNFNVKQQKVKDINDDNLLFEFNHLKSLDIFENMTLMIRYALLFNEIEKRKIQT